MDGEVVRGRRFTVIGAARSGVAVAQLLQRHGGEVFVTERGGEDALREAAGELRRGHIPAEFGGHTQRALSADVLVVSPGVPSDAPVVQQALRKGVKVVSEVEVAAWFCRVPIVAITGTNGKTTTTALTGRMFEDARKPGIVAGNIGTAFSQVVDRLPADGTAVLEISSFQLDHIDRFRPKVAALLNITPDHLDRYEHAFEKYIAAKRRIFENQGPGDALVYNRDDEVTRTQVEMKSPAGVDLLPFSVAEALSRGAWVRDGRMVVNMGDGDTEVIPVDAISIPGKHNLYNAMAATLASRVMGVSPASIRATLRNFKGVEHRLEFVREVGGIVYVNDSKATNVDSVWYALQSYAQPIVLILGGRDKGNDYTQLLEGVRSGVRAIVAIGESAEKVVRAFSGVVPTVKALSMKEAVEAARRQAHAGDIVLLSPACASFDWFQNFEHRGRVFKEIVAALEGGAT